MSMDTAPQTAKNDPSMAMAPLLGLEEIDQSQQQPIDDSSLSRGGTSSFSLSDKNLASRPFTTAVQQPLVGDSLTDGVSRFKNNNSSASRPDSDARNRIVKTSSSSQSSTLQFASTKVIDHSIHTARTVKLQDNNNNNQKQRIEGRSWGEEQVSWYESNRGTRRNRAKPSRTPTSSASSATHSSSRDTSQQNNEQHDNNTSNSNNVSPPLSTRTETSSFVSNRTMGYTNDISNTTSSSRITSHKDISTGSTESLPQSPSPPRIPATPQQSQNNNNQNHQHHRNESLSDASAVSAWKNTTDLSSEKMESSTQRTERSDHEEEEEEEEETVASNSLSRTNGDGEEEDDDNSTIRSVDSSMAPHDTSIYSYSSATTTPVFGYTMPPTTATFATMMMTTTATTAALESSPVAAGMQSYNNGDSNISNNNYNNNNNNDMSGMTTVPQLPAQPHYQQQQHPHPSLLGTPSTTSTAPSTADDGSFGGGMDVTGTNALGLHAGNGAVAAYHHRVPSWEGLPQPQQQQQPHALHHLHHQQQQQLHHHYAGSMGEHHHAHQEQQDGSYSSAAAAAASNPWGPRGRIHLHPPQQQQRVASFRDQGYPPMPPTAGPAPAAAGASRWQTPPPQSSHRFTDAPVPFLPAPDHMTSHGTSRSAYHPRHQHQQQQQQQHPLPASSTSSFQVVQTPPRGSRPGARLSAGQQHGLAGGTSAPHSPRGNSSGSRLTQSPGGSNTPGGGGPRSSSEVLKTLLRKKACLYEPDTSRAVTLITWLVGRHLALENGFFSRQQLQAGVHSCVASKIASGVITRTKVNRCMQIILNSCFHYIIPRPDGTEENGAPFRALFAKQVSDDEFLLQFLPNPWNDMTVDRETVLKASLLGCEDGKSPTCTPQPSPQLTSRNATMLEKNSPGKESADSGDRGGGGDDGKRAVLLCFNENVRCAEDVFRCHNEFIRDTAHATHLQLSSLEWRNFFGKEAAGAPFLWGNVGIPVPHQDGKDKSHTDALGVMTSKEAAVVRTSWCTKRYDHNHELCGFAHSEVNGGWLRRNPNVFEYKDEMCPSVSKLARERSSAKVLILNECPHGVKCSFAHSVEEILYHPRRYKTRLCHSAAKPGGCMMGDICPHFHPMETYRFPKKSDARSPRHARQSQQNGPNKGGVSSSIPSGAPTLYASPAPLSSFDQQLLTPGLQNLYRRHCAVSRALIRSETKRCYHSYFGDDTGIDDNVQQGEDPEMTNKVVGPSARTKR